MPIKPTPEKTYDEFVFPVSGHKILLRRVSTTAIGVRLRRLYPKPIPEAQEVQVAPGKTQKVYNFHDPEYAKVTKVWGDSINEMAMGVAFALAPVRRLSKEQEKLVAAFRDEFAGAIAFSDEDSDFDVFLEFICFETEDDIQALANHIRGDGEPEEETVESAAEGFSG